MSWELEQMSRVLHGNEFFEWEISIQKKLERNSWEWWPETGQSCNCMSGLSEQKTFLTSSLWSQFSRNTELNRRMSPHFFSESFWGFCVQSVLKRRVFCSDQFVLIFCASISRDERAFTEKCTKRSKIIQYNERTEVKETKGTACPRTSTQSSTLRLLYFPKFVRSIIVLPSRGFKQESLTRKDSMPMYINRHACLLWLHWQSHLHDEDAKCHEWKGEVCVRSFTHEGPLLLRVILYTNLDSMIMIIISSDCMLLLQLTHSLMTIDSVFLTSSGKRDLWVELHSFSIEIEESLTAWFRWTGDKGVSSQERVTVIWLLFGRKSTTQDEGLIVLCVLCSLETRFVCLWSLPCLSCVCVSRMNVSSDEVPHPWSLV